MKKERILKMAHTDLLFLSNDTKREFISLTEKKLKKKLIQIYPGPMINLGYLQLEA